MTPEEEFKARRAAYQRAWRKKNPEKANRYKRNWEKNNREKYLAQKRNQHRKYYANEENRKRRAAFERLRQKWKREYYREATKAWRAKNREAWNAHCREYKLRKSYGDFAEADRFLIELIKELKNGQTNRANRSKPKAGTLGNTSGSKKQKGRPKASKCSRVAESGNHARRAS